MRPSPQVSSSFGVKIVALVMAFGLAFYLLAPPSLRQRAIGAPSFSSASGDECPSCVCECADKELIVLPDCERMNISVKENLDENSIDLISEELKLQERISEENQVQADAAFLEAKKLASQYQKEAEKCSSGMGACEEAREKVEAALADLMTVSAMWEKRARELGWHEGTQHQSILSRIGLTGSSSEEGEGDSFFRSRE